MTLSKLISLYVGWLYLNKAKSTALKREYLLTHMENVTGGGPVESLTPARIDFWARFAHRNGQPVSDNTVNTRITAAQAMFNWAVRMRHITINPIAGMPKPAQRMTRDFIPRSQWGDVISKSYAINPCFGAVVEFMFETGTRVQEIKVMRWSDYDKTAERIVLPADLSKGRKRPRTIYLTKRAVQILNNCSRLFNSTIFQTTSLHVFMVQLKEYLTMPTFCATVIRHSFAHDRLTRGMDATTLAKLMGHASVDMIYSRYGHLESGDYLSRKANEYSV